MASALLDVGLLGEMTVLRAQDLRVLFRLKEREIPFIESVTATAIVLDSGTGQFVTLVDEIDVEKRAQALGDGEHFVITRHAATSPIGGQIAGRSRNARFWFFIEANNFLERTKVFNEVCRRSFIIQKDSAADRYFLEFTFRKIPGNLWWDHSDAVGDIRKVQREMTAGEEWFQPLREPGGAYGQIN